MTEPSRLSLKTIAKFLVGNHGAIKTVASSPKALFPGLLFIISAGPARNYDHHLLFQEPRFISA